MNKLTETTTQKLMGGAAHGPMNVSYPGPAVAVDLSQHQKPRDPLKPEKVAIIGTAPSSRLLAPFNDPSWTIWGSSPGNSGDPGGAGSPLPRLADAWIEVHANFLWPEYRDAYGLNYVKWLNEKPFPTVAPIDLPVYKALFPKAAPLPWKELVGEFGPYFFTSTFSWMMAYAIKLGVKEIGLFGVDMSSKDEYILQRPGGHYFIMQALQRGIKVLIPDESDLIQPSPLYGIHDSTPWGRKASERKRELTGRIGMAQQRLMQAQSEMAFLQGAVENEDYHTNIWGGHSTVQQITQAAIDKATAA